jgi:hypothetical protein
MCCVVIEPDSVPALRAMTRGLLLPGQRRLHFHTESDRRQRQVASDLLAVDADVSVFVCRSAQGKTAAHARAECLAAIVTHLQELEQAVKLVIESRHEQDADDHPVIWAARRREPVLDYEHLTGDQEPLLWLPDAFAWLVGAGRDWQRRIAPAVTRVIDVS